jgi:hypothetical protein
MANFTFHLLIVNRDGGSFLPHGAFDRFDELGTGDVSNNQP